MKGPIKINKVRVIAYNKSIVRTNFLDYDKKSILICIIPTV